MATSYRYQPQQLDLLAAAVVGRAYKDAIHQYCEGEYIKFSTRREARRWWREEAPSWCECLQLEIALPQVPEPEPEVE